MKRPRILAVLAFSLLVVLAACNGETTPAQTADPSQTTALELKQAAQELWDVFSTSTVTLDAAAALHGIFIADIRKRCTIEQMQESLWSGEAPFPNIEVGSVFLDLEDPSRALIQLDLLDQPRDEAHASGFAFAFPFPLVREQGEWRLGFPILANPSQEGCPFSGFSSNQEEVSVAPRQLDATPQSAFPRLAPPPGAQVIGGSSGGGRGEYDASVLLATNLSAVALLEHYRQQVLQPDWKVQRETMDEGLAAFSWTLRDEEDQPWFGVLLVTPAKEGMWVRLWMGGGGGIQTFVFPEGPIRPN